MNCYVFPAQDSTVPKLICSYLQFPTLQPTKQKSHIHQRIHVDIMVIPRLQGSSEILAEELQLRRGKGVGNLGEKKSRSIFVQHNENMRKR